jgi:glycosyltransferase involved in cell wall biosynthesis
MQIVLATTARIRGGVWRHIEDLGTGLQRNGHRVVVGLIASAPELVAACERAGLETRDFRTTIGWRDWVWHGHLHDTYDTAFLEAALRRRFVGPTVLTEHLPHTNASDPALQPGRRHPLAYPAKTGMKRLQFRAVERVIAVSPSSRRFLASRYGERSARFEMVMHGVSRSPSVASTAGRDGPARVIAVGQITYQKGFDVLVDASAGQLDPHWRAVVLGDGAARGELERRAAESGIVTFSGWSDDVGAAMARADIVCMPSRWESAGYAALEAMDAGRPVVVADVDGLRDIVEHEVTGLIVKPEDAVALGAALNRLASDERFRRALGRAGRVRAARFTVARMVDRTTLIYEAAALS